MLLDGNSEKLIYLQLAEEIEDKILHRIYDEETQIPSITEMSVNYKINPATANRAVNLLVEESIVYKKRGIGMYVSKDAVSKITAKRSGSFINDFIKPMLKEADKLGIEKDKIIEIIKKEKMDRVKE